MKVIAVHSFVSTIDGVKHRVSAGDEVEMPSGADWLTAGLVMPAKTSDQEAAVMPPQETAAMPRVVKRGRRAKK